MEKVASSGHGARLGPHRDDGDPHEHAAGDEVEHELHRPVFLGAIVFPAAAEAAPLDGVLRSEVGAAAPHADEQVHRHNGQLVEEEEEEEVRGQEDAVHARHQQHQPDEEVLGPVGHVPGHQHARHEDDGVQQDEGRRDAGDAEGVADAQRGQPREVDGVLGQVAVGVVREEEEHRHHEPGQGDGPRVPVDEAVLVRGEQHERQRPEEGHRDQRKEQDALHATHTPILGRANPRRGPPRDAVVGVGPPCAPCVP